MEVLADRVVEEDKIVDNKGLTLLTSLKIQSIYCSVDY
jgi:hypothetical protein